MNPSPVLVVTGFDAKHFDLALDLAESFRAAYQDRYRLAAIVFGAEPAPPALAAHFDQVMHLADAGAGFGAAAGYVLAYAGLKARLREVFPGHAAYIWIDADCWMQGDESLAALGRDDVGTLIEVMLSEDVITTRATLDSIRQKALAAQENS